MKIKLDQKLEAIARAICIGCEEDPDHVGDAQGNEFRWQDYLPIAEKAMAATDKYDEDVQKFFAPVSFEQVAEGIEVGYDLLGGVDIRINGEFNYVHVNYHGLYASNAARTNLTNSIVELLKGGTVVSSSDEQELKEFRDLANALNMGLPVWPTKWSQDVAALAFFVNGLQEKSPNEAHSTPEYKDFVRAAANEGMMPWYDSKYLENVDDAH